MSNESLGYLRVDSKGIVRAWDERMAAMMGYGPGEILGLSMELLIPKSYRERHWRGFLGAMSHGGSKYNQPTLNVPFRHKGGTVTQHPTREIFLLDAFGSAIGVLAIVGPACSAGDDNGLPSPYADALEMSDQ